MKLTLIFFHFCSLFSQVEFLTQERENNKKTKHSTKKFIRKNKITTTKERGEELIMKILKNKLPKEKLNKYCTK